VKNTAKMAVPPREFCPFDFAPPFAKEAVSQLIS
jgi:hypothetical protein